MEKIILELKDNGIVRNQELSILFARNKESAKYYSLLSTEEGITILKDLFESLWETMCLSSGSSPNWETFTVYTARKVQDFKTAGVEEMRFLTLNRDNFLYGFGKNADVSSNTIALFVLAL